MRHIGARRRGAWIGGPGRWLYDVHRWQYFDGDAYLVSTGGPESYYVQRDIGMEHRIWKQWLRATSRYFR